MELVVLAVEGAELGTYEQLLPLYFPRTEGEEHQAQRLLPKDVGGPHGEPLLPERGIRIVDKPFGEEVGAESDPKALMDDSVCVGNTAFARMHGDVDRKRHHADPLTRELQLAHRCVGALIIGVEQHPPCYPFFLRSEHQAVGILLKP